MPHFGFECRRAGEDRVEVLQFKNGRSPDRLDAQLRQHCLFDETFGDQQVRRSHLHPPVFCAPASQCSDERVDRVVRLPMCPDCERENLTLASEGL